MNLHPEPAYQGENFTPAPVVEPEMDPLADLIGSSPDPAPEPSGLVAFAAPGDFLSVYGLRENPFADCVHPAFFFRTEGHAEAFRSMMLAAEFNTALGLITG